MSSDFGELLVELADKVFDADTSGEQRMDLLLFDGAELILPLGQIHHYPLFLPGACKGKSRALVTLLHSTALLPGYR